MTRHVEIVTEAAPVADQGAADPLLVAPAGREQMLGVNQSPQTAPLARPVPVAAPAVPVPIAPAALSMAGPDSNGKHVAIVGDESGVAIVRTKGDPTPKLRGGFGRQQ